MLYKLKKLALVIAVASVASCGGGGGDNYIVGGYEVNNGSSGSGAGTAESRIADLEIAVSSRQLASDGSDPVIISAVVKDANNNIIRDVDVQFAVDNGGTIEPDEGNNPTVTSGSGASPAGANPAVDSGSAVDSGGTATTGTDAGSASGGSAVDNGGTATTGTGAGSASGGSAVDSGGTATTGAGAGSASSGSAVKTATLKPGYRRDNRPLLVRVTAGSEVRTINVDVVGTSLAMTGPDSMVLNSTETYTVKLTDSAGTALSHQVVSVTSEKGNKITPKSGNGFATDNDGQVSFDVTAINSGTDKITVSALGASSSQDVSVSEDHFVLSSTNHEIKVNTNEVVNLVWTSNGVPQANKDIQLAATRGVVPASIRTDANGRASFVLSSVTAGGTVITAENAQADLSATMVREFVAIAPKHLTAQPEQSSISPKGHTTLVATVRDQSDNPVKNQKVRFNIVYGTVNGSLSSSTAVTDSLGRASVVYTAGNASSARDGVQIQVSLMNSPEIVDTIKLSVGDRAVQIVLGNDENMVEDGIYYKKTFGVIVTDSTGNPVANKPVNFNLVPVKYYKGAMVCDEESGPDWQRHMTAACDSEDSNDNAILDLDLNEDFNSNGRLDPTHTATITNRSVVTDDEGKANVEVVYLQSHALWSKVRLTASTAVDGTEYTEALEFVLSILADDVKQCLTKPTPNRISPYGVASQCASAK